jgi:hypothetical protein
VIARRSVDGRLLLRIESHEGVAVGKKWDAYQKAAQAEKMAKSRLSDVQGGSTEQAYGEAIVNAQQAERIANEAWDEFANDQED